MENWDFFVALSCAAIGTLVWGLGFLMVAAEESYYWWGNRVVAFVSVVIALFAPTVGASVYSEIVRGRQHMDWMISVGDFAKWNVIVLAAPILLYFIVLFLGIVIGTSYEKIYDFFSQKKQS